MESRLEIKLFENWVDFIYFYIENNFYTPIPNPDDASDNQLVNDELFLSSVKEVVANDIRKAFGKSYEENKTSDKVNLRSQIRGKTPLIEIAYIEYYIHYKEFICNYIKEIFGQPSEYEFYYNKARFLSGLKNLVNKSDPSFLPKLQEYLSTSEYLLTNIKKYLGISDEDHAFDNELSIICKSGYQRLFDMLSTDEKELKSYFEYVYSRLFKEGPDAFGNIFAVGKEWLCLYVKLSFDPPTASTLTYLKERLNELEWYIVNYSSGDLIYGA